MPSLGDPRTALDHATGPLPQHPRYRGYWIDAGRDAVVGMHLGVDLIRSGDAWHVLELNLSAGMRLVRARLHRDRPDPMVTALVAFAAEHGFGRVVALRDRWTADLREELRAVGRRAGLEVVAADRVWPRGGGPGARIAVLPAPLEADTLYVVFSTRHTAIDHFVHDKGCTAAWLPEHLPDSDSTVRAVPTGRVPFAPGGAPDERWPDLVVKLADRDRGDSVRFVKLRPGQDLLEQLGMEGPEDTPAVLRGPWWRRGAARLPGRHDVLYQPFVRPPLTDDGRTVRARVHLLATPAGSAFLSAYEIVSGFPVPPSLPPGPVADPRPFLGRVGEEGGFRCPEGDREVELRRAAATLGEAVRAAVTGRFLTSA